MSTTDVFCFSLARVLRFAFLNFEGRRLLGVGDLAGDDYEVVETVHDVE